MSHESSSPAPAPEPADSLSAVLRDYLDATGRLQQTHAALQLEIGRLRQELASKDRELELRRRLAALGEMAAGVAHEVRNPLGAIQLYSGLLRNECRRHHLTAALRLIEKIESGVQAIEAVVHDTLALAPRERELSVLPLRPLLERVHEATRPRLDAARVRLVLHVPDPGLCVRADEDGLQRVLVNLVLNAAEASPPDREVRISAAAVAEGEVELRVADEGAGLPEEIQHRIFDPFFTTKPQGTGLGLTIAHRLVEAYGGRMTAANRPGGGAEFAIFLPQATPTTAAQGPGRSQPSAA